MFSNKYRNHKFCGVIYLVMVLLILFLPRLLAVYCTSFEKETNSFRLGCLIKQNQATRKHMNFERH